MPKIKNARSLRFTVLDILHDGKSDQLFRALASHAGQSYMVTSRRPLDVKIGDDLHATGLLKKAKSKYMPHEFFVSDPTPSHNRGKDMLKDEAEIRSFKTDAPIERPALIMADKLGLHPLKTLKSKGHYATISPLKTSDNPILQTALDMFKTVKADKPIYLIDPEIALTTLPYRGLGYDIEDMLSKNMRKLLQKSTPAAFEGDALNDNHGYDILHPAGRMCPIILGLTGGKIQTSALVTPYNPYATSTDTWRGMSGLNGTFFAPKANIDPSMVRLGTVLHELAHAVQEKYDMRPLGTNLKDDAARNLRENFADSFEIFATLKLHGKKALPFIKSMTIARATNLYGGRLCHATANGRTAALKEGLGLLETGKLETISTDNLLKKAAKIAKEHAYSVADIKNITDKREALFEEAGCYTTPYENSNFKQFDQLKAWQAFQEKAPAAHPDLGKALSAIKAAFYTPDQLISSPEIRKKALKIYKADIETSFTHFGWKSTSIRNAVDMHDMSFSVYNAKGMPEIEKFAKDRSLIREAFSKDERLVKNQGIEDRMAENMAVISLPPAHRHQIIAKAFTLSPELRLTEWKRLCKATLKAIEEGDLKKAQKLDQNRHDYAFALRADSATWQKLKSRHPAKLMRHIAADTTHLLLHFTKDHAAKVKTRLLAIENSVSPHKSKHTKPQNLPKSSI